MIPEIKADTIHPLIEEIHGPSKDPYWVENMWTRLRIDQPVLAAYLEYINERDGQSAALAGLIIYRLIESQIEIDDLEELFDGC